jgi:5-hydroxyisourate hydrolase
MAKLSTHVLDTHSGQPAQGMAVALERFENDQWISITSTVTNRDGRTDVPLLEGERITIGRYRLIFKVANYFRGRGVDLPDPPFLEDVSLEFGVAIDTGSYHVPLLCSPWSYSTYRGS